MNQISTYIVTAFFTLATFSSFAQDSVAVADTNEVVEDLTLPKVDYLYHSSLSFTVPNPISNNTFKNTFLGIYQIRGAVKLDLFKGIRIGVNFSNAQFKIDKNIIRDYNINVSKSYNPRISVYSAAVSLGGTFYVGEKNRIIIDTDVSVGQNYATFNSFSCKDSTKTMRLSDFKSIYGEVTVNLYFLMETNWGLGPSISYTLMDRSLSANELCLEDWTKSKSSGNQNNLQYLNFGFVAYYSFFRK